MIQVLDGGVGPASFPLHRRAVLDAFHNARFPWHRVVGDPVGFTAFQGLTVRLLAPGQMTDEGRAYPWGEIHITCRGEDAASTAWVFLHEASHVIDVRSMTSATRTAVIEAMGLDPADGWNRTQANYLDRPREGFAIHLARDIRPAHWPIPGDLAEAPTLTLDDGAALAFALADPVDPWPDLDAEAAKVREAVRQLADRGVTVGMGLGVWGPAETVTRRDMALFMVRLAESIEWRSR